MSGTGRLATSSLIGSLALLCCEPATAAPDSAADAAYGGSGNGGPVLEEIVVTATKRSERLLDVPLSVSAITADEIQARGFTQFSDYINSIPGVYFQDGGIGDSVIHIRGATESGVGSTVATYFGEAVTSVLTNHGGKPNLRLVDIDRVEVLRGPQGTLFGADALAGVLRIIPAAPDLTRTELNTAARGFTTAHSDNGSYHVEGVLNLPLIQDRVGLRLVAYKDDIAGYIDNVVANQPSQDYSAAIGAPAGTLVTPAIAAFTKKDINREHTWGTRATLRWQPLDRLRFDLNYTVQDARLASEPFTDPAAGPYEQKRALDAFEPGGYGERVTLGTLTASYDWDTVSLISITNYMRMKRFTNQDITYLATGAFGAPIPWALHDNSLGRVFTQEVRLQSRGEQKLQWTVGGFYLHQQADLAQFVPDYSCPQCLPTVLFGQSYAFNVPNAKFSDQKQRSVFGEVSYEFLPRWTVGAGGRYLKEDIEAISPGSDGLLAGGPTPATAPVAGSIHEFNPSGYIRFKPSDDTSLYVQASRGFRSGDVNEPYPVQCQAEAATAGIKAITNPDTLTNYELGLKSRFADGRLSVNAAVYKDNWHGVQLGVALACGFSGVVNAGNIEGKGVELELLAEPTPAWKFNLSLAYNQNHFKNVLSGTGFTSGQRLPEAPEKNASAGAQYNFRLSRAWTAFARGDYVYVGDVLQQFNTVVLKNGGYGEANARLGFIEHQLEVDLYGDNLTDKRGISVTSNPAFGAYQTLVRPRELGVEVRYSFR
jgi:outer membrane receptor protein involved in Fe transport